MSIYGLAGHSHLTIPAWMSRRPENWGSLPQAWPESGERQLLADGSEIELVVRTVSTDPLENIATRQIRARLWRDGELVKEEIHTQNLDDYSKNELVLMLERTDFLTYISLAISATNRPRQITMT